MELVKRSWVFMMAVLIGGLAVGCFHDPNEPPIARIDASPTSGVAPLEIDFDAGRSFDPDELNLSYTWEFGDGATATGETTSHTYTNPGTFTATVTATDSAGASSRASTTIEVNEPVAPNQAPVARINSSPMEGTAPLTVNFDAGGSSDPDGQITSYRWDFGDGSTGTGHSVAHTYRNEGSYQVRLTVRDDDGASTTSSTTINVGQTQNTSSCPTTVENQAVRLRILSAETRSEIGNLFTPDPGFTYAVVTVEIIANADNQSVGPFHYKVEEEDGTVRGLAGAHFALPNSLDVVTLDTGQRAEGQLAFEVRQEAREIDLHREPFLGQSLTACFRL